MTVKEINKTNIIINLNKELYEVINPLIDKLDDYYRDILEKNDYKPDEKENYVNLRNDLFERRWQVTKKISEIKNK